MKHFKVIAFLVGMFFFGGCDGEDASNPSQGGPGPVEKPELLSLPEMDFPKVDLPGFRKLPAEPGAKSFRWNLVPGERIRYELSTVSWTIERSRPRPDGTFDSTRVRNSGDIDIVAESEEGAKVRFTLVPEGVDKFDREKVQRLDFLLKATGAIAPATRDAAMQAGLQLDHLIRLPEVPLKEGETWEEEVVFHGSGSTPSQFGTIRVTRMGRVGVAGEACDRLRLDLACELKPSSSAMEKLSILSVLADTRSPHRTCRS